MSYLSKPAQRTQRQQLRPDQVENNAGGFVWEVPPLERMKRFLVLGSEGGTHYQNQNDLTYENVQCVQQLLDSDDWPRALELVVEISNSGRASRNDMAVYALAMAAAHTNVDVRREAANVLPLVVRTGTHLFMFEHFLPAHRGRGTVFRRGMANWYNKTPDHLAYQFVKYRERKFDRSRTHGKRHADLIKISHPAPANREVSDVIRWAIGKQPEGELPQVIQGFEAAQAATSSSELAQLLDRYPMLPWEALPRDLIDKQVWRALLPNMPVGAMIRNLATMTRAEAIQPMGGGVPLVLAGLRPERLQRARIHPIQVLAAHLTYASGYSVRGDSTWQPITKIVDALDQAFYDSFNNIEPTGRRTCLALDVSGSMFSGSVGGVPNLTPAVAAAAMALVTAATEPLHQIVGFTTGSGQGAFWRPTNYAARFSSISGSGIEELPISSRQRMDDVVSYIGGLPMGGTDCALPIRWAHANQISFDQFVIYTDNETWAGDIHPAAALQSYRSDVNKDAKLVVVGMTSSGFSIADPNDPGMLDLVGFDTSTPQLISSFATL